MEDNIFNIIIVKTDSEEGEDDLLYARNQFGLEQKNLIIGMNSVVDDVFSQPGEMIVINFANEKKDLKNRKLKCFVHIIEKKLFCLIFSAELHDQACKNFFQDVKTLLECYSWKFILDKKDSYTASFFENVERWISDSFWIIKGKRYGHTYQFHSLLRRISNCSYIGYPGIERLFSDKFLSFTSIFNDFSPMAKLFQPYERSLLPLGFICSVFGVTIKSFIDPDLANVGNLIAELFFDSKHADKYIEERIRFQNKSYVVLLWFHLDIIITYFFGVCDENYLDSQKGSVSYSHLFCKEEIKILHKKILDEELFSPIISFILDDQAGQGDIIDAGKTNMVNILDAAFIIYDDECSRQSNSIELDSLVIYEKMNESESQMILSIILEEIPIILNYFKRSQSFRPSQSALIARKELFFLSESKDPITGKNIGILVPEDYKPRSKLTKYLNEIPTDLLGESFFNESQKLKYKCHVSSSTNEYREMKILFFL